MRLCSALGSPGLNQSPPEGRPFSSLQTAEVSRSQGFLQGSEILDHILRWGSEREVLGPARHKCVCVCGVHVHAHVVCAHVQVFVHLCACVNMCESIFVHVDVGRGQGGTEEESII